MAKHERPVQKYPLQTGSLLVAEPFMLDPHFKQAVVLVCDYHEEEGAFGLILNKPLGIQVDSLLSSMPNCQFEVFYGGPVQTDVIHFLHTQGDLIEQSHEVAPGLFWGGSFEQVKFCIEHELITEKDLRFFVGYTGWDSQQLVEELETTSWLTAQVDLNYVFKRYPNLWKSVLEGEGDSYSVIAQMAGPIYN